MNERIRWGVIGSGGIARRRTIPEGIMRADNALLAAVFDADAGANGEVASQFGAAAAGSMKELLARDDVDAVYVATPADLHCRQVLAAAKAGKHVLCEKPLGLSRREDRRMIDACREARLRLGVGFMMRFVAQHQAALEMIRQGRLGRMVFARAQLSAWYPPIPGAWRQDPSRGGGGSLIDMGSHCIDLLEMFLGPARRVSCRTGNLVQKYPSEDAATVLLEFDGGAHGVVDAFFCIPDAASLNRLEIYGSAGAILAEGTIGQGAEGRMVALLGGGDAGYDAQQSRQGAHGVPIAPTPVNPYQAEIAEFGRAVLEGRQPAVDGQAGLRSTRVLGACYKSARTGRSVEVPTEE